MATQKIVEDFPGAYSGKVSSWERKTRLAVGLLEDQHGYSPGVVLRARAPATITATAVTVPDEERRQYGRCYIGVQEGSIITPRKLAASLSTPASAVPLPPPTPTSISTPAPASAPSTGSNGSSGSNGVRKLTACYSLN